jgi:hypothetical protein
MGRPGETIIRFDPYQAASSGKPSTDDVISSTR